jgi:hypothetical protein
MRANFERKAILVAPLVVLVVALRAGVAAVKPVHKAEGLVLAASQQVAAQEDTPGNPVVDGSHVTGYLGEELHYFEKDYCHSVVVGSKSYYSFVHSHNLQNSPDSLSIYLAFFPIRNNEI